jgi:hypothetical protein
MNDFLNTNPFKTLEGKDFLETRANIFALADKFVALNAPSGESNSYINRAYTLAEKMLYVGVISFVHYKMDEDERGIKQVLEILSLADAEGSKAIDDIFNSLANIIEVCESGVYFNYDSDEPSEGLSAMLQENGVTLELMEEKYAEYGEFLDKCESVISLTAEQKNKMIDQILDGGKLVSADIFARFYAAKMLDMIDFDPVEDYQGAVMAVEAYLNGFCKIVGNDTVAYNCVCGTAYSKLWLAYAPQVET